MNPVNLADGAVVKNLLGLALFVFLIASTPLVVLILLRISRETKIRGPALAGTAHVLSLKQTGLTVAVNEPVRRMLCRIGLRVEVPGRQPYDATVRQRFSPWEMGNIQPGSIVSVQVDSTNPQNVRIGVGAEQLRGIAPLTSDQLGELHTRVVQQWKQSHGLGQLGSAADLLASDQRVPGVLKSFAATGTTLRSLGQASSRPELTDAPQYVLEVELQFPNLAPITGRDTQPVPAAVVPNLAIGLQLACAVDPASPSQRFVVDWDAITH